MTKTCDKEVVEAFCGVPGNGRHQFSACAFLVAFMLGGCSGREPEGTAPEFGSGVVEYKQITEAGLTAARAALDSLNRVSTQSNPYPPDLIVVFSHQVQQLQIDSLRIRARAQAIQARGDAYFATWSESIADIKDPQVRHSVEHHQPELEQCFFRIKLASQRAGSAFKPFLAGLRMLRVHWEKDPALIRDDAMIELVRTTREHGNDVVKELESVREELQAINRMLAPAKSVAKY